ncbi:hypothetical protein [Salmonella enterica]|uniref:hypothetical protein n=1 Tax=Salmonella enterica TaxID=28901 RepID=UPI002F93C2B0
MNDNAFTFQTLHPETIMDALFEQGIRVDSGLTPLNSYETASISFRMKTVDVLSLSFIVLNAGLLIKFGKNTNSRLNW